ncbi:MAG: hypothetical protein F6K14_22640 [Symploca sp. SIO2C1]|nr:hypothetical protein [Symploca sp. SIO2C1]
MQLPIIDRWQLVQTLLDSLQGETHVVLKKGNLSRLEGLQKLQKSSMKIQQADYVTYLTQKYQ